MSDQWLYRIHGQEFGPVSLELVRSLVESGAIAPDDDVRNAARSNWILACAAIELRDSIKVRSGLSVERRCGRDEWFCHGAAGDFGPLKLIDLIQLAVDGELGPEEEIKSHADDHWKQVRSIRRLVELLPFSEQKQNAITRTKRSHPRLVGDDLFLLSGKSTPEFESTREREPDSVESILHFSRYGKGVLAETQDTEDALSHVDRDDAFHAVQEREASLSSVSAVGAVREQPDIICFPGIRLIEQSDSSSRSGVSDVSSIDFIVNALAGAGFPSSFDGFDPISLSDQSDVDLDVSDTFWSGWAVGEEFTSVRFSELLSWAVTGRLLPTDFVRCGDDGQYVPAVNIPALFTVRAAANSLCRRTASSSIGMPSRVDLKPSLQVSANLSETLASIDATLIFPVDASGATVRENSSPSRFHCRENYVSSIGMRVIFAIALALMVWVAGW